MSLCVDLFIYLL